MEKEIIKITFNPEQLEEYTFQDKDNIPVCSFLHIYEAIGLFPYIEEYKNEHSDYQLCAITDLSCNFYTLQFFKRLINLNWGCYELDIKDDNKIIWNTKKYPKGTKHYEKTLKSKIKSCINLDFANYCPGLDDELEDYVLKFAVIIPDSEENDK